MYFTTEYSIGRLKFQCHHRSNNNNNNCLRHSNELPPTQSEVQAVQDNQRFSAEKHRTEFLLDVVLGAAVCSTTADMRLVLALVTHNTDRVEIQSRYQTCTQDGKIHCGGGGGGEVPTVHHVL